MTTLLLSIITALSMQGGNVITTYVSGSCDTVALKIPMGVTRDSAQAIMATIGMTPTTGKNGIETYTTTSASLLFVVSYKQSTVNSVFMYIKYDILTEAEHAAETVNHMLATNHGEHDPKTQYFLRRCYDATYAVRATPATLATGSYLCLAMIAVR